MRTNSECSEKHFTYLIFHKIHEVDKNIFMMILTLQIRKLKIKVMCPGTILCNYAGQIS